MKTFKEYLTENKIKEGLIRLKTPLTFFKDDWGDYQIPGITAGVGYAGISKKEVTIKQGKIIAMDPKIAKRFNLETVGDIEPKSQKTIDKELKKLEQDKQNKNNAKVSVFILTFPKMIQRVKSEKRQEFVDKANIILKSNKTSIDKVTEIEKLHRGYI